MQNEPAQATASDAIRSLYYDHGSTNHDPPTHEDQATVSLTVSTSSDSIQPDADDDTDPFYLTVTARVVESAKPDSSIIIATGPGRGLRTPLSQNLNPADVDSRAVADGRLGDMVKITDPEKRILAPRMSNCGTWSGGGDLRERWEFVTLPSMASGEIYEVRHRYPMSRLREQGAVSGETYAVGFSNPGKNTGHFCWYKWGSLDEFEGQKFQYVGGHEKMTERNKQRGNFFPNKSPIVDEANGWTLCEEDTSHGVRWMATNVVEGLRIV